MADEIVNTDEAENTEETGTTEPEGTGETEDTGEGGTGETGGTVDTGGTGDTESAGEAGDGETNTALLLVKSRLNRPAADTSLDSYLQARINAAAEELARTGITLTDSADDLMLLVDLTVWEYQNRDKAAGMPDWLRLRRRERWLQQQRGTGT